ncbi:hypothetical protein D3C72_1190570 [compost metagenome]
MLGQIRRGPQVLQRGHGVVAGQGRRRQAPSQGVQPQRRRTGQDTDGVPGPDRIPVLHPLDVVPHPVPVHEPGAGLTGDVQHPPVDIGGDPGDHALRRRAQPLGPEAAHLVMVAADAARGQDDGVGPQSEIADHVAVRGRAARRVVRRQDRARHPGDAPPFDQQLIDPATVVEGQASVLRRLPRAVGERLRHTRPRPPGDVKARHGIAVTKGLAPAALGPAHHGRQADAVLHQPGPLLAGGELDIGAGPLHCPFIFGQRPVQPVPARAAPPVSPGQIEAVAYAQLPLFRRVDQEQPAERPEGLSSQVGGVLLIDQRHALASLNQLVGGDQPGQTPAHHDDVRVHACPLFRDISTNMSVNMKRGFL